MANSLAIFGKLTFADLIRNGLLEVGDGYRAKNEELGGDGPIFLRAGHVSDTQITFEGAERFRTADEARFRGKIAQPGDVVVTTKGWSTGRVAYVTRTMPRFVYSPHLSYWRSLDPNHIWPEFLRQWSRSPECQRQMNSIKMGIDIHPYLSLATQHGLRITLPPLAEQKAIATVLGALDDKIELNRRMNATLESMARALFQSWFVDFDPVRAKLDNREPGAMNAETAALFPDYFEGSPFGHIPKGWTAKRLPEAIEVNPRRTLKAGMMAPYLDMKNLPKEGHSAEDVIEREFTSGTRFQNGDTLLARITPCLENGKTGYVDFLEDGQVGWGSTEYIILAPKPPLPPQFGYLLARSDVLRTHAIQNMTGTSGRQRVPAECFNTFWLAVPTPEIARRFAELTAPLMDRIKTNTQECRSLVKMRDLLLPNLLSGKLTSLNEAENKIVR